MSTYIKLKNIFRIITTPTCWVRNYGYCEAYDRFLNGVLDNATLVWKAKSGYEVIIGEHTYWIANHPYASFTLGWDTTVMASRTTVFRAMDMYKDKLYTALNNQNKASTEEK